MTNQPQHRDDDERPDDQTRPGGTGTDQEEEGQEESGGQVSEAGSSFGAAETGLNGADAVTDKTTGPGASNQER